MICDFNKLLTAKYILSASWRYSGLIHEKGG